MDTDGNLSGVDALKEYFTNAEGFFYSAEDGPFSAKPFGVLDFAQSDGVDGMVNLDYIVHCTVKPEQFDLFRKNIIDPIMGTYWKETIKIAKDAMNTKIPLEEKELGKSSS